MKSPTEEAREAILVARTSLGVVQAVAASYLTATDQITLDLAARVLAEAMAKAGGSWK